MMKSRVLPALLVAIAFAGGGVPASAEPGAPDSFEQAQRIAEARGVPLLVGVGAEWSKSWGVFLAKYEGSESFRAAAAEGVVLFPVEGESGEGDDIVRTYGIIGYPTFVLADAAGEMMDSWQGFKGTDNFLEKKADALSDPITILSRMERFREDPTEADAAKLGDFRSAFGYPAEAVAYYQRAHTLNPASDTNYDLLALRAMVQGAHAQLYTTAQIRTQADVVFSSAGAKEMASAYYMIEKVARRADTPEIAFPYLRTAYEALQRSNDEPLTKIAAGLEPEYALHIERDEARAVRTRIALMPEGWREDGRRLNQLAWWCFENEVNLTEAEELARRGVELSKPGRDKANVLDTLAEICNLNNDCAHAVEYIRMAVEEDPKNEYFLKQLGRFEEVLATSE